MDTGMLLVRVVVGLLLIGHGAQHALGWFGGYGAEGTGAWLEGFGFGHGRRFALLLGWTELAAGALFATGLFVPVAGAAIVGVALGAAMTDHGGKGPWIWKNGFEYVLVLAVVAVAVVLAGPGAASFDDLFGWTLAGTAWGLGAAVAGVLSGLAVLSLRSTARAAEAASAAA